MPSLSTRLELVESGIFEIPRRGSVSSTNVAIKITFLRNAQEKQKGRGDQKDRRADAIFARQSQSIICLQFWSKKETLQGTSYRGLLRPALRQVPDLETLFMRWSEWNRRHWRANRCCCPAPCRCRKPRPQWPPDERVFRHGLAMRVANHGRTSADEHLRHSLHFHTLFIRIPVHLLRVCTVFCFV